MLNGVFTDDGVPGMNEAADIKKLDIISPFVGALSDRICTKSSTCAFTAVFTEYVDVVNQVCG